MHIVTLDGCGARYLVQIRRCSELIEVWVVGLDPKTSQANPIRERMGADDVSSSAPIQYCIELSI